MNPKKLYNLFLDGEAKQISKCKEKSNLTTKFEDECKKFPYLTQCKVYDI
tara:strand:+ start:131 stop:280 length:150 start_codon:yes stop_codon:yes gene_type:complete